MPTPSKQRTSKRWFGVEPLASPDPLSARFEHQCELDCDEQEVLQAQHEADAAYQARAQ